jgi:hypothetical protein
VAWEHWISIIHSRKLAFLGNGEYAVRLKG